MNARHLVLSALAALAVGCGYEPHAIPSTSYDVAFPRGAVIDESTYVDRQGFRVSWALSQLGQDGVRLVWALTPREGEAIEPGDHTAPAIEAFRAAVGPHGCTERPSAAVRTDALDGQDLSFACAHGSLHARVLGGPTGVFFLVSSAHHETGTERGPDASFLRSLAPHELPPSAGLVPSPVVNTRSLEPLLGRLL